MEVVRLCVLRLLLVLVLGRVAWLPAELRLEELAVPKEMPLSTLRRGSSAVVEGKEEVELNELVVGEGLALWPPVIS